MTRRIIRASEIGAFLYCRRAWWYRLQGVEPQNREVLGEGTAYHLRHGKEVWLASLIRLAGWLFLSGALILLVVGLTLYVLR